AAVWFLDRDPARHGLAADGAQAGTVAPGLSLLEAMRSPSFRSLYAALMAASMSMFVPFAHLSAAARDAGIAETQAVALVGLIGIGSLLGRFGLGALADRLGRLRTHVLAEAALGASFLIWAMADHYVGFAVFAILFGFSYGG